MANRMTSEWQTYMLEFEWSQRWKWWWIKLTPSWWKKELKSSNTGKEKKQLSSSEKLAIAMLLTKNMLIHVESCWKIMRCTTSSIRTITIQKWLVTRYSTCFLTRENSWGRQESPVKLHPNVDQNCLKKKQSWNHPTKMENITHRIHVWYIYPHLAMFMVNIGKYTIHWASGMKILPVMGV